MNSSRSCNMLSRTYAHGAICQEVIQGSPHRQERSYMQVKQTQPFTSSEAGRRVHGFSLLELLVVMAAIGLLLAIILPALGRLGRVTGDVESLATMRQLSISLSLYMDDSNGRFPYFGTPGQPDQPLIINDVEVPTVDGALYFRFHSWYWISVVMPYISGRPKIGGREVFIDHGYRFGLEEDDLGRVVTSRYHMTYTAFAVPEFWETEDTPADLSLLKGTRLTHVLNPARKGILIDVFAGVFASSQGESARPKSNEILIAFGDGSSSINRRHPQAPFVERPYQLTYNPIMATKLGLRGIDF